MSEHKKPKIGLVTSVNINQELREVRLNVLIGQRSESRDILAISPSRSAFFVPEEGEYVVLSFIDGRYVATAIDETPEHEIPDLSQGDVCITLDAETALHFSKQADGTVNIDLSASGDVSVTANGEQVIGDISQAVSAAIQNHTHNYSWTDSGGSGSTGTPNETGTETLIE